MLKNFLMLCMLSTFVVSLAACQTVKGAAEGGEEDIEAVGDKLD
jgi:predicted small secreted protein